MHAATEMLPEWEYGATVGQGVHADAPLSGENEPDGQGVHMIWALALKNPAPHSVCGTYNNQTTGWRYSTTGR